jgi:nitroimidazol reductase NimA-like FMN-containing flavoprotein (pyridoxamine 5'-phosphate oxidase superfamily)
MTDSYGAVELLDRARCVELLTTVGVGRVVFTRLAMPAVRPVRYVVRDNAVWFRVPDSDVWLAGALDNVMAFTVDDATRDEPARWSVTVLGRAIEVRDRNTLADLARLLPDTGGPADDRYVRLLIESVTGRAAIPPGAPCADDPA